MRRTRVRTALAACGVALASVAAALENPSFERVDASGSPAGWVLPRGAAPAAITVDARAAKDGAHSLRITQAERDGVVRVTQSIAAPRAVGRAERLRLRAYVRTGGDEPARVGASRSAPPDASVWLRIDGERGFLAADSREGLVGLDSGNVRSAPVPDGWTRHEVDLPLPQDSAEIVVAAALRGGGSAWFDGFELERFDAGDLPPPSAAARRYVDAALEVMQRHSLNRRSIDWPAFRSATLEQARGALTPSDAHGALRFALRNLGDRHSYLVAPRTAAALRVTAVSNARTGRAAVEPRGEWLDGIGYVALPGFAGGTPADQVAFANRVQQIIAELDGADTDGWILDLRRNTGGNFWPMLAGAGPLLGGAEAGASIYPDGRETAFWYDAGKAGFGDYVQLRVSVAPHRLADPQARLAVLVDGSTASSAEVLALALRARGNSVIVGVPTRGLTAGNRTFDLADGASLVLTVAATRDRNGRIYVGAIDPDVAVPPDAEQSRATLDAALAWLSDR